MVQGLEELRKALESGADVKAVLALAEKLKASVKADEAKANAEQEAKIQAFRAEADAAVNPIREAAGKALEKVFASPEIVKAVKTLVRLWGEGKASYTAKVNFTTGALEQAVIGPVFGKKVKGQRAGAGGGRAGKAKDVYGLTLNDIFGSFATGYEREALSQAVGDGNAQHGIKEYVRCRAVANGELVPLAGQEHYPAANSWPSKLVAKPS